MNSPLNVLFLTSWYPVPEYPTHGIFIRNLALSLQYYCKVIVIYVYSSKEIEKGTLKHTHFDNLDEYVIAFPKSKLPLLKWIVHFFKYLYYYYRLSLLIKRQFKEIHFAQINVIFPVSLFFPIVKRILHIKKYTIFEQWSGYLKEDNSYKGLLQKWITKRTIKNADKIWCLSEYQKQAMEQHRLYGNYEIIGNVVNTEIFCVNKIPHTKKRFIHISTLDDKEKNITGILTVFSELEKQGYNFELIVVGGKEEYLQKAIKTAQSLGLSQVEFKGIIPQNELPTYYHSADALVMFSHYETFCVVVYEALSCGTYVISSNVANLDKILSADIGTLVAPNNKEELKNAILNVLENKIQHNPDKAHRLIEQKFSEKQIGKKLFEYYANALNF